MRRRTEPTKVDARTADAAARLHIGLVYDSGTSAAGLHGLTDLFRYVSALAPKRLGESKRPLVRVTHWLADQDAVLCTYDDQPDDQLALSVLILPANEPAALPDNADQRLLDWLRNKHAEGVVLAAVCGGVFILARTGLLTGRQATTHWALSAEFAQQFPTVLTESEHMVIDNGDVITAGGVLAWVDLGLRVTERFFGPTLMMDTARYMNFDPPGREQRFYADLDPLIKHGDNEIFEAQLWLTARRELNISVAQLARHARLEPRTFLRRFTRATGLKPSEYQQRLRIGRARELLEFSRLSVDQIASRVGYEDVAGFRRVFRKIMGITPSDYRRRFGRDSKRPLEGRA